MKLKIKLLVVLMVICLLAVFHPVMAEEEQKKEETYKMAEIVVTASRSEQNLDLAPSASSIITSKEIEKFNIQTLDEALRFETNVYHRNGMGILMTSKPVTLRGIPGESRTLIMLDGIPMNSGFNGDVEWNNISMNNVERIEVIRGSGSSLYGGNAMGGIINIITKSPEKLTMNAHFGYGEQETSKIDLSVSNKLDRFSFMIGGQTQETDGYAPYLRHRPVKDGDGNLTGGWSSPSNTGYNYWVIGDRGNMSATNQTVNLMMAYDTSETGKLKFDVQWGTHESEYDNPHSYIKDINGNTVWSGDVDAGNGKKVPVKYSDFLYGSRKLEQTSIMPSLTYKERLGKLDFMGIVSYKDWNKKFGEEDASGNDTYENAPGTLFDSDLQTLTSDLQLGMDVGSTHYLTVGSFYRNDDYTRDTYELEYFRSLGSKTEHKFIIRGKEALYAFYLQDQWDIIKGLTVYTGLRWDNWKAYNGKSGKTGAVVGVKDYDENHLSPKLAVVWQAGDNTYVRGSVANSFRGPTISELFYLPNAKRYKANPDLKPETMWNYEIGADQYLLNRRIKISGAVYHSEIEDMISRRKVDGLRFYDNFSEAKVDGVEAAVTADMTDWLRLWGNISYNRTKITKDKTRSEVKGKWLPGVPEIMGNVGCDAVFSKFKLSIGGNFLGKEYTSSDNSDKDDLRGGYAERWLWNAKLSCFPLEWIEASISVDNIFDNQDYEWVYLERGRFFMAELGVKW